MQDTVLSKLHNTPILKADVVYDSISYFEESPYVTNHISDIVKKLTMM